MTVRKLRLMIGICIIWALCAPPAVAGHPQAGIEPGQIQFTPLRADSGMLLTISGPGELFYREQLAPGASVSFPIVDKHGNRLPDGSYSYELMVVPKLDPEASEALDAARMSGDYSALERLRNLGKLPATAEVHRGSFAIANGSLVATGQTEKTASDLIPDEPAGISGALTKDQCIYDDLVVDGSLCVGNDCTCNYAFGFDTIVLKENNLRIFFDDTSSIAGYPTTNWRITINDSTSGGASYFSIDDADEVTSPFRIEAGAPSSSLYVEDMGRVGFGTSTPYVELHVKDGDSPTLRLEQDGSYGFTPQTWDISGNETNFFVRDATSGSRLPLRIRPSAPTSSIDIAANGDVGVGTGSPGSSLHISRSDATAQLKVEETNGTAATRVMAHLVNNGGVRFDLEDTANSVNWVLQNQTTSFEITKAGTGIRELMLDGSGNLTITGTMTVRSGHANQTTYPDFVFAPDYQLMPLDELQEFIAANQHLPEVPAAESLTEDGINMTEMQLKLLQKVEELTLYTLAQQSTIKTQHEEIEQLKRRLSAIEQQADQSEQ